MKKEQRQWRKPEKQVQLHLQQATNRVGQSPRPTGGSRWYGGAMPRQPEQQDDGGE